MKISFAQPLFHGIFSKSIFCACFASFFLIYKFLGEKTMIIEQGEKQFIEDTKPLVLVP